MDNTHRIAKYKTLPEPLMSLYGSLELGGKIISYVDVFNINDQLKLTHAIGDTILGFYHTKDLPALLQQEVGVSADVSQRIVADLAELLAPVLEREALAADPQKARMKALQQQFGKPTPAAVAEAPSTTAPTTPVENPEIDTPEIPTPPIPEPDELHNVTPMRTMAADMTRVHGYGAYRQVDTQSDTPVIQSASQEDLLKPRPRLTNIPKVGE